MAQASRHDEAEIESQAKEVPLSLETDGQNNAFGHKMMVGAPLMMVGAPLAGDKKAGAKVPGGYVRAEELKYDNPEDWKITRYYAVLNGTDELRVCGKYSTQKFGKKNYEVSFHLRLKDDCNINEVDLTLTLPDGSTQKRTEGLEDHPRNKRISINVGKFFNSFASANIEFELKGTESHIEKEGLVMYGVLIKADA